MIEELRDRIASYLAHHRVCVLSLIGAQEVRAMPVQYRGRGLEVECLIPRWADVAYYLEQSPQVLLVIQGCYIAGLHWLQYRGVARPVAAPDWAAWLPHWSSAAPPGELYLVVRVTPERIVLFDESKGWGMRETLDLGKVAAATTYNSRKGGAEK